MSAGVGAGGYITDLVYPDFFHRETSPAWIACTMAAIGQRAPALDRPWRYLDLGCGTGYSTALLAAANPGGRFVGVDINPRHIELARRLGGDLPNLTFLEAGFDILAAQEDGLDEPFDFIVLHGIYSWLSAERRADVHRLIGRWLAPGGVVYLHYSTHPGQSAFAGARAMLLRIAALTSGDSGARLGNGMACLRALEQGGAGYMREYPQLEGFLRETRAGHGYLAHELLAADWTALHVGDVIDDMEHAGCAFVGSATLLDNVDVLSIPGAALPVIQRIGDIKARETARDLARNQSLRRDLYRRALAGLPPDAYGAQLAGLRFCALPALGAGGDLVVETPIGPVSVDAAMVDPVRRHLAEGPASFAELAAAHRAKPAPGLLLQAVLMLIDAGEVHHAARDVVDGRAAHRLNRLLAERGGAGGWLAAPAIGSAVAIDAHGLRIAACLLENPALHGPALAQAVQCRSAACPPAIVARFERDIIPRWRALGVLPA
ncbi:MAG TPA: class I SAM-dependent methyltransferase [Sphingobium sp.]|nr:class I SAM-dependent methyltransferase [Sphingobium sp.]